MNVLILLILVGLAASDTLLAEPGPDKEPAVDVWNVTCSFKSTELEVLWNCIKAIPGPLIDFFFKCPGVNMQITGVDGFRKAFDELCKIRPNSETVYDCVLKETESNATLNRLYSEYRDEIDAGMVCVDKAIKEILSTNKAIEE